jgi:hypothetical protein
MRPLSFFIKTKCFRVVLGLKLIRAGFGGIHVALVAWLAYFSVACVSCFLFKFWARKRIFLKRKDPTLSTTRFTCFLLQ